MSDWAGSFYEQTFAELVLDVDPEGARAQAAELVRALGLRPGDRVLDQCCGNGRLSLPLAALGMQVVGVDQSAAYVQQGLRRAAAQGLAPQLVAAQAQDFRPSAPVKAVINWHTSFAYSPHDAPNRATLRAACQALVADGVLLLDVPNASAVQRHFKPVLTRTHGLWTLTRHSALDRACGVLRQRWVYEGPRRFERSSILRLYTPEELRGLALEAGFTRAQAYADMHGAPLGLDDPRCVLRATAP